jgi:polysaccharide export outer membrane protein
MVIFASMFSYNSQIAASNRGIFYVWFALAIALLSQTSCVSYKNQIFFQGLQDTAYKASTKQPEPVLQRGDQLMIMVYAFDQLSAAYFNAPMSMGGAQGGQAMMQGLNLGVQSGQGAGFMGYLVDEKGEITFPKIGNINILGYTQPQLRDSLEQWLLPYLKEPSVSVRLLNFRVTLITPDRATTMVVANNKTNILQFLGMVQGVQWLDKRDNVLLVRQVNEVRQVIRIDFTDTSVFNSPAFYLQPNDVIYIEPHKRRFYDTNLSAVNVLLSTVLSSTTLLFLIYNSTR